MWSCNYAKCSGDVSAENVDTTVPVLKNGVLKQAQTKGAKLS
jgi:hypothetical protein